MRCVFLGLGLLVLAMLARADVPPLQAANELARAGKAHEAFLAYLHIPGAEYLAARAAHTKAGEYLPLLATADAPLPVRKLVEGDLLLEQGKRNEALACYRAVSAHIAADPQQGWAQGLLPRDYYPVDPPEVRTDSAMNGNVPYGEALPFTLGPGSHRDNWLIRRFIALQAWDDAAKEFARVWALHQSYTKPYVVPEQVMDDPKTRKISTVNVTIHPVGYTGPALLFALDYAYFLKRQKLAGQVDVLMAPLLLMDMDHNPSLLPQPGMRMWRPWSRENAGTSRKEYLRLVYGELKALGKEADLVAALQQQIDHGDNRARRVLACVRLNQGDTAGALALELAYLDEADNAFQRAPAHPGAVQPVPVPTDIPVAALPNLLSTTYRRGLTYENAGKLPEAAAQYEKALALPFSPLLLPDPDEDAVQARMQSQLAFFPSAAGSAAARTQFQQDVLGRLQRIDVAQGKPERALEISLRQFAGNEGLIANLGLLESTAQRFTAAGQPARFTEWAAGQAKVAKDPTARANLCWLLQDYHGAIQALAQFVKATPEESTNYGLAAWKERFRKVGRPQYRALLLALLEANPQDERSQLDLLLLDPHPDQAVIIAVLEKKLDHSTRWDFTGVRRPDTPFQFHSVYDLAAHLMLRYQQAGMYEKMVALGFRMLDGAKPFTRDGVLTTPHIDWSEFDDRATTEWMLQVVYRMLPYVKSDADKARLRALADASTCVPLKNQLARLLGTGAPRVDPAGLHAHAYPRVTVRTLGLPAGVHLLTNRDDVRALSPDGRWVGTSWGLVRYTTGAHGALDILQMPLGSRVSDILATPAGLFARTGSEIYLLRNPNGDTPSLARVPLELVKPRYGRPLRLGRMIWWKDALYASGAWRYDPAKQTVQYLGREDDRSSPFDTLFGGAGHLWSANDVLDEASGVFTPLSGPGKEFRLLGATAHEVWADVYLNDAQRHRPALVDPETHAVRVLPITDAPANETLLINQPFVLVTEDADHVWLRGEDRLLRYDRAGGELHLVPRAGEGGLAGQPGPAVWQGDSNSFYRLYCGNGATAMVPGLALTGDRGPTFRWQTCADGKLLLGSAIMREWQEDNFGVDDGEGMSMHVQDLEGGLFVIDPATLAWEKLGAPADELSDFYVNRIVFDDAGQRAYVCTNGGVTVLSLPENTPVRRITVSDGLPSNKVMDVARVGGKLFFACELGDAGGGLAVMDEKTGVLHTLTTVDGLTIDKVKRLRVEGTRLHLYYGSAYNRGNALPLDGRVANKYDSRVCNYSSSVLDTETGEISAGTGVALDEATPAGTLPVLGGALTVDVTHGDTRFLGGTHGLLLLPAGGEQTQGLTIAVLPAKPELSLRQQWLADVAQRRPHIAGHDDLAKALQDANPYYRAEAMSTLAGKADAYVDLLATQLNDPDLRVRTTACYLVAQVKDDATVLPLLQARVQDADPAIRQFAALSLARHGVLPDIALLREMLAHPPMGNMPFGAYSSIGIQVDRERFYQVLAPMATPQIFALMLEYPAADQRYGPWPGVYAALGASLRAHPEATAQLLTAHDDREHDGRVNFARLVCKNAGAPILPALYTALSSEDRVLRSNAARACGAIGDRAAIPHLLAALELESGLARASIVWALGELHATAALPKLAQLYVAVKNDEQRHRGAGFRYAQAQAVMRAQYTSLSNLDVIGADWNELSARALEPVDPTAREELLSAEGILQAVRQIGADAAQAFYRTLAGEQDPAARRQAAAALAEGSPADRAANLPILRNLLADDALPVRQAALVSLLILHDGDRKAAILAELNAPDAGQYRNMAHELHRVHNPADLEFAQVRLQAIAKEDPMYNLNDEL